MAQLLVCCPQAAGTLIEVSSHLLSFLKTPESGTSCRETMVLPVRKKNDIQLNLHYAGEEIWTLLDIILAIASTHMAPSELK